MPLCGAAPTFFAAAKKVGKESRSHRQCQPPFTSRHTRLMAPERLSPRTILVSDKAVIHPAARCARCGWVCTGNRSFCQDIRGWVMPFGARSADGRMTALSLRLGARGDRRSGAIRLVWCEVNRGWHWRCERLSFAYFSLPLQRKVGAAPHRGNACIPTRLQASPKAAESQTKTKPQATHADQSQTSAARRHRTSYSPPAPHPAK